MKVLFLASNPENMDRLALDREIRSIEEKIKLSKYRGKIELSSAWAVRPSDLLQKINEYEPDIIHFSGHGESDGSLNLEGADGEEKIVKKEAIDQMIKSSCKNVKMILFNACFSNVQAKAAVKYVDVAIGMEKAISDKAAIAFAYQIYSSIGFGKSIADTFEQAKTSIMLEGVKGEEIPQLHLKKGIDMDRYFLISENDRENNDDFECGGNKCHSEHWNKIQLEVLAYLKNEDSVNLISSKNVKWGKFVEEVCNCMNMPIIDFEAPKTFTRKGLIEEILDKMNIHYCEVPDEPYDLTFFSDILKQEPLTYLCFVHFDMVKEQKQYDVQFFSMLRYLTMERFKKPKKLVLFIHSHEPISRLLPLGHPLSEINVKSVYLRSE